MWFPISLRGGDYFRTGLNNVHFNLKKMVENFASCAIYNFLF